jgi:tRNA threonylcarbamoyladenosine biosynthesis protein TsaB
VWCKIIARADCVCQTGKRKFSFVTLVVMAKSEPVILAIETATRAGSVSLARGEIILASTGGDASSSHSTDLIENVQTVLRDADIELGSVDVFAAASGPGSFTGLRIGLATAKALAVSMERKCAGVSTLAAIAVAAGNSDRTVAMLPAGRGEVFVQMFAVTEGRVEPLDAAAHINPRALLAKYKGYSRLRWAGEGAHMHIEALQTGAGAGRLKLNAEAGDEQTNGWTLAPPHTRLAEAVAKLAMREWLAGNLIEPQQLHANYLRASDAELRTNT